MLDADGQADHLRVTPAAASSPASSWECVVEAGWIASDFASPMLARWQKSSSESMKRWPASAPPLIPKVRIAP